MLKKNPSKQHLLSLLQDQFLKHLIIPIIDENEKQRIRMVKWERFRKENKI